MLRHIHVRTNREGLDYDTARHSRLSCGEAGTFPFGLGRAGTEGQERGGQEGKEGGFKGDWFQISNRLSATSGEFRRARGCRWRRDGGLDGGKQGIAIDWLLEVCGSAERAHPLRSAGFIVGGDDDDRHTDMA